MRKSHYKYQLSSIEKLVWLTFTISFGIIPMFVYFGWIERNLNFRYIYPDFLEPALGPLVPNFPWYSFSSWSLKTKLIWNFALVTAWGVIHSLFAQHHVYELMSNTFPLPTLRAIYVIITGLSCWAVMSLWQPIDIVMWHFFGLPWSNTFNFMLNLLFVSTQIYILLSFDIFHFLGISQIMFGIKPEEKTAGTQVLRTDSFYGLVRHPLYLFMLASFFVTPFMTLDRLLFAFANCIFLLWAIPIEETKLEKEFGSPYLQYKQKVPCLIPFLQT